VANGTKSRIIIDGIKEIINVAAANASTSISELLDKTVLISVPDLKQVNIYEFYASLSDYLERDIYAGIVKFKESISGYLVLFFDEESFKYLSKTALTKYLGENTFEEPIALDVFKEIVNIFASSYTTALYNFIGVYATHTPPEITHDFLGSVVNTILSVMTPQLYNENILLVKVDFRMYGNNNENPQKFDAWMVHFMTDSDVNLLCSAIESSIQ